MTGSVPETLDLDATEARIESGRLTRADAQALLGETRRLRTLLNAAVAAWLDYADTDLSAILAEAAAQSDVPSPPRLSVTCQDADAGEA